METQKFTLKHFSWVNGTLLVAEELFEELEHAIEYAESFLFGHVKIWNHCGELVHHRDCDDDHHHHHYA